jgi:hypothetical protein
MLGIQSLISLRLPPHHLSLQMMATCHCNPIHAPFDVKNQHFSFVAIGGSGFYHKRIITCHHTAVGGVTSVSPHFFHYTQWHNVISYPLLMTRESLPRILQTALSDTHGTSQGASFEPQLGMNPPEAICVLSSSSRKMPLLVFPCDALGPDLSFLPFQDVHIWVQA